LTLSLFFLSIGVDGGKRSGFLKWGIWKFVEKRGPKSPCCTCHQVQVFTMKQEEPLGVQAWPWLLVVDCPVQCRDC
jgi:hypothetical protein